MTAVESTLPVQLPTQFPPWGPPTGGGPAAPPTHARQTRYMGPRLRLPSPGGRVGIVQGAYLPREANIAMGRNGTRPPLRANPSHVMLLLLLYACAKCTSGVEDRLDAFESQQQGAQRKVVGAGHVLRAHISASPVSSSRCSRSTQPLRPAPRNGRWHGCRGGRKLQGSHALQPAHGAVFAARPTGVGSARAAVVPARGPSSGTNRPQPCEGEPRY